MRKIDEIKNRYPGLHLFIVFILICIPLFLLYQNLYLPLSIYIILISSFLIWLNWGALTRKIKVNLGEYKKVKKLKYYHITDDNKDIDLDKRRNIYSLFSDTFMGTAFVLVFNFIPIYFIIKFYIGESAIFNLASITFISFIVFIVYAGMIAGIVYKYTTTVYVSIPIISFFMYFSLIDPVVSSLPVFVRLGIYIFNNVILYFWLTYFFPVHVLRNLNGKTVLISSFTTIIAAFFSEILLYYFSKYIKKEDFLLNIDDIRYATDISDTLKIIILDNPEIVDVINHFLMKEASTQLTSMTSIVVTALTISYIIGGLLVNFKIGYKKNKAKAIYRKLIQGDSSLNYQIIVQCAFYGGEDYENLLLNNQLTSKIIKDNEANLNIPDTSLKTKIINLFKRNFISKSNISDKEIQSEYK